MQKKFAFDYDSENDSLFLYNPKSKSKASVELDDLIIDFNTRKEICALEILNASRYFTDMGSEVSRELLGKITGTEVEIVAKSSFFLIKFMLFFKSREHISTPILVPTVTEQSPAIA